MASGLFLLLVSLLLVCTSTYLHIQFNDDIKDGNSKYFDNDLTNHYHHHSHAQHVVFDEGEPKPSITKDMAMISLAGTNHQSTLRHAHMAVLLLVSFHLLSPFSNSFIINEQYIGDEVIDLYVYL